MFSDFHHTSFSPWFLDSCATSHICCNKADFIDLQLTSKADSLKWGDGGSVAKVLGTGSVQLRVVANNGSINLITLTGVKYAPDFQLNIISVGQLRNTGATVIFGRNFRVELAGKILMEGTPTGANDALFQVQLERSVEDTSLTVITGKVQADSHYILWHKRLGHPSQTAQNWLIRRGQVGVDSLSRKQQQFTAQCVTCIKAKITKAYQHLTSEAQTRVMEMIALIHSEVWGPYHIATLGGYRYFVSFIEDRTRVSFVFLMKTKDEVLVYA